MPKSSDKTAKYSMLPNGMTKTARYWESNQNLIFKTKEKKKEKDYIKLKPGT